MSIAALKIFLAVPTKFRHQVKEHQHDANRNWSEVLRNINMI